MHQVRKPALAVVALVVATALENELSRAAAATRRFVEFAGGLCEIGHAGAGFAFDNEGPAHDVLLRPFAMASRPVTVGEYADFIQDHGYDRPELWLWEGFHAARAGSLVSDHNPLRVAISRRTRFGATGRAVRFAYGLMFSTSWSPASMSTPASRYVKPAAL